MENLLVSEKIQKKITRGHQRQLAELSIVTYVVRNNDIAVSCNSTHILQEILKVTHVVMDKCGVKLMRITRKNRNAFSETPHKFITVSSWNVPFDIVNIGKGKIRGTYLKDTPLGKFIYRTTLHGVFSFINNIDENVCVKKYFHFLSRPKIHLVRSSAASWGVSLNPLNSSSTSGEISNSAIFLAKNSSSALRLVSSASRIDSCKKSTTAFISFTSILLITSMYGAIGVDCTLLVASVMTTPFFKFPLQRYE